MARAYFEESGLCDPADVTELFYLKDPSEVELIKAGHPSGYQVLHHHRFCHSVKEVGDNLDDAIEKIENRMRVDAFYMECNAVIGWEIFVYWDEEPTTCGGSGNCVLLQPYKG